MNCQSIFVSCQVGVYPSLGSHLIMMLMVSFQIYRGLFCQLVILSFVCVMFAPTSTFPFSYLSDNFSKLSLHVFISLRFSFAVCVCYGFVKQP